MRAFMKSWKWVRPILFAFGSVAFMVAGGCSRADHTTDQALQKIATTLEELKAQVQQQEVALRELSNSKHVSVSSDQEVIKKLESLETVTAKAMNELKVQVQQQEVALRELSDSKQPPVSVIRKLESLEAVIAQETQWPKSREDAKRLNDELQIAIKQVPPSAEESLLPRINALRWNVEALWALANAKTPLDDEWNKIQSDSRSLLRAAPDNKHYAIYALLEQRSTFAEQRADVHQREAAKNLANDAINGKADPAKAWAALEAYESDPQYKDLRGKLRVTLLERTTEDRLKVLQTTLDHAKASGNDRRAQGAIARVYDAATGIVLDLDIENPPPKSAIKRVQSLLDVCETEMKAINHRQQVESDKKVQATTIGPRHWRPDGFGKP